MLVEQSLASQPPHGEVAFDQRGSVLVVAAAGGHQTDLLAAELDLELIAGFEVLDLNQLLEAGADAIGAL